MPGPEPPQFLVIGHVVQDLLSDEGDWRLGGTVSYAGLLAARLGLRTVVLTAAALDLDIQAALPGVEIARVASSSSTQFRNIYTEEGRVQRIPRRASPLTPDALPDGWEDAEIVLLGPVAGEVDVAFSAAFPRALLGVSAQGWLRDTGPDDRVRPVPPQRWQAGPLLRPRSVLFVSDEDIPQAEAAAVLADWSARVDTLAYTHAERGADVYHGGAMRHIDAFPTRPVDPTGAGDVFAAAFLARYRETGGPWEAARFAACASSFIIEGEGLSGAPDRAAIDRRLREHPEIVAR